MTSAADLRPQQQQQQHARVNRLKVVAVGDADSGKAALLARICRGGFAGGLIAENSAADAVEAATWCDDFMTPVELQGGSPDAEIYLTDTSGQERHDRLRPIWYQEAQVIWLCFSVMQPGTLANAESFWMPELLRECRADAPVLLVGTAADHRTDAAQLLRLRERLGQGPVTSAAAKQVAGRIGAAAYAEVSARTGRGLQDLLRATLRVTAAHRQPLPSVAHYAAGRTPAPQPRVHQGDSEGVRDIQTGIAVGKTGGCKIL